MTTTTPPPAPIEPLVSDEAIVLSVYQLTYRVVDALALQDLRNMMYGLRDSYESQRQQDKARIVKLEAQLYESRGDSGPNPVVEWKGWNVELAFGEEGDVE